eukprot:4552950-Pyramimonas_sp.AAC.1
MIIWGSRGRSGGVQKPPSRPCLAIVAVCGGFVLWTLRSSWVAGGIGRDPTGNLSEGPVYATL